jgi:phosphatidylinositol-3-phosphatase
VQSFGTPSADPYLAKTLLRMGALLENYYAIGHASADNYIAQVSGQAPDLGTQADCPLWIPFPGHVVAGPSHQILGEGCVYPAAVPTLGNQLPACSHPATWSADRTRHAERGDQYAARHDGFAFFQSVTANPAFCAAHILSSRPLPGDLTRASGTTAFSFLLAPNPCNDGHDAPCVDGAPVGLAQADRFLARGCRSSSPRRPTGTAD